MRAAHKALVLRDGAVAGHVARRAVPRRVRWTVLCETAWTCSKVDTLAVFMAWFLLTPGQITVVALKGSGC